MKKILSVFLAAATAAMAVSLGACSGENQSESSEPVSSSSEESVVSQVSERPETQGQQLEVSASDSVPALTTAQITEFSEKIDGYSKIPSFNYKAPKINAAEIAADKGVTLVTKNSTNSYYSLYENTFKTAAKNIGFKDVNIAETDGNISSLNDGLISAADKGSDFVILEGDINKGSVSGYIELTQANGIEVFSAESRGIKEKDYFVDYTVPINYELIGELMADWGIVKTEGKINALAVNCTGSPLSDTIFKGFKAEFEKNVSKQNGYCTTINASSIEVGTALSSKIKKALQDDSNINYIFVFDEAAIGDAIKAAASADNVKVVATGGSKEAFDYTQSGNLDMLVSRSYEWTAYAVMDYSLRIMSGAPNTPDQMYVPFRLVTKDVIEKEIKDYTGTFDGFYEICFGAEYIKGYRDLWQL